MIDVSGSGSGTGLEDDPVLRPPPPAAGRTAQEAVRRSERAQAPELSYVVATVGVPDHLAGCLESIYRDAAETGVPAELLVVLQHPAAVSRNPARKAGNRADGPAALRALARQLTSDRSPASDRPTALQRAPRILELPRPAGFARAMNAGIAASRGRWIALVNDDAVLAAGWTRTLLTALSECAGGGPKIDAGSPRGTRRSTLRSRVAAVQGLNLLPAGGGEEARIDGAGLTWNNRRQAVQVDRGKPAPPPGGIPGPVYGVSATAAIYRRDALIAVSPAGGPLRPFDERLDSYYEDVELADRLRRASYEALLVPAARIEHAGALSSRGRRAARRRVRRIYCNRLLVLARQSGRSFWLLLPGLLLRDAVDLLARRQNEVLPGDSLRPGAVDLLFAWGRAAWLLPHFAKFGRAQLIWRPRNSGKNPP